MEAHLKSIESTLSQLQERCEDLKTRPVSDSGEIASDDPNQKNQIARRKVFSQKVFHLRDSLLTAQTGKESGIRTLESIFIAF
jgi:hypothetical protein